MTISNGILSMRDEPARRRQGCETNDTCRADFLPPEPIKTTQNTEYVGLSSQMDLENLSELKSIKIVQGNAFVMFQVLAVGRYADPSSRHGTVLVLYTLIGEITLDGTAVLFQESMEGTFSRAGAFLIAYACFWNASNCSATHFAKLHVSDTGLDVDKTTNRRLLGVVELVGMFNAINRAISNTPGKFNVCPITANAWQ